MSQFHGTLSSGPFFGTPGDDSFTGTDFWPNIFDVSQGGNDTVIADLVGDIIIFGASLTGADFIYGSDIFLDGDYSGGVTINAQYSTIDLGASHSYKLTTTANS